MRSVTAILALALSTTSAAAFDLYEFIDNSDGYVNIRQNVVLIEGNDEIKICRFGLSDAFFDAYGAGDEAAQAEHSQDVICVPVAAVAITRPEPGLLNTLDLYNFIDTSESYEQVRENVVMIEGDEDIKFCRFQMSDAFFDAYGAGDAEATTANAPKVTCVQVKELSKP